MVEKARNSSSRRRLLSPASPGIEGYVGEEIPEFPVAFGDEGEGLEVVAALPPVVVMLFEDRLGVFQRHLHGFAGRDMLAAGLLDEVGQGAQVGGVLLLRKGAVAQGRDARSLLDDRLDQAIGGGGADPLDEQQARFQER
jgi:hypothetical protein